MHCTGPVPVLFLINYLKIKCVTLGLQSLIAEIYQIIKKIDEINNPEPVSI